jgi:hypothetical protein
MEAPWTRVLHLNDKAQLEADKIEYQEAEVFENGGP